MAGEDLLEEGGDSTTNTAPDGKKKHKPLSKGQKIGVAIGVITIVLVIVEIERNKANAATTAASATPASATDPGAAYEDSGGGGGSGYWSGDSGGDNGLDPSTGIPYSTELSTLGSEYTNLNSEYTTLQTQWDTISTAPGPGPDIPGTPGPKSPTSTQASNLAKLNQELGKDQAAKKPNTKAIATLKKQIAAVQKRS